MLIIFGYILGCVLLLHLNHERQKLNFFLMFIVLTFISGYRSVNFTGDNIAYAEYYILNSNKTIGESFSTLLKWTDKDPFYYFLGNLFSKLGYTYRGWFVFIAATYNGGFFYLVYKRSKDYIFSICFMICLSYFYFSMTGLRQAMSMGLLFFAINYIYERKIILFILFVLFASLFHSSALVFLPAYYIVLFPVGSVQYLFIASCYITAIFFPLTIGFITRKIAWNDYLAVYADRSHGLTITGFIIQLAVFVLCALNYLRFNNKIEQNKIEVKLLKPTLEVIKQLQYEMNLLMAGTMVQAFAINIDNIFRISMYFSIVGALAIPNVLFLSTPKDRAYIKYGFILFMLFYILRAGSLRRFTMFGEL